MHANAAIFHISHTIFIPTLQPSPLSSYFFPNLIIYTQLIGPTLPNAFKSKTLIYKNCSYSLFVLIWYTYTYIYYIHKKLYKSSKLVIIGKITLHWIVYRIYVFFMFEVCNYMLWRTNNKVLITTGRYQQ